MWLSCEARREPDPQTNVTRDRVLYVLRLTASEAILNIEPTIAALHEPTALRGIDNGHGSHAMCFPITYGRVMALQVVRQLHLILLAFQE